MRQLVVLPAGSMFPILFISCIHSMRWFLIIGLWVVPGLLFSTENWHIGARSSALANASVTLTDLWAVQHNQACLALVDKPAAGLFYENRFLLPETGLKGGAMVLPTNSGVFGLMVSSFGYSKYGESKYGLAYARKLGDNFAMGLQLDYLQTRIAENYGTSSNFAAEIGLRAKINEKLAIGVHVFNVNRALLHELDLDSANTYKEHIPTVMRVGVQYTFSEKVFAVLETEKDIDHKAIVKVGVEYHITEPFYLRLGVSSHPFQNSFGFGMKFSQLHIDVAASYHSVLGYSPQLSISYHLK